MAIYVSVADVDLLLGYRDMGMQLITLIKI